LLPAFDGYEREVNERRELHGSAADRLRARFGNSGTHLGLREYLGDLGIEAFQ